MTPPRVCLTEIVVRHAVIVPAARPGGIFQLGPARANFISCLQEIHPLLVSSSNSA